MFTLVARLLTWLETYSHPSKPTPKPGRQVTPCPAGFSLSVGRPIVGPLKGTQISPVVSSLHDRNKHHLKVWYQLSAAQQNVRSRHPSGALHQAPTRVISVGRCGLACRTFPPAPSWSPPVRWSTRCGWGGWSASKRSWRSSTRSA